MEIKSNPFSTDQVSGVFDFFFFLFLISIFLWANTLEAGPAPAEFFKDNCSSCHTIGEGELVGSDLKDIAKRRDKAWLGKFIVNAKGLFEAKDPIAIKLFKEPDDVVMPPFPELDDEKVQALVDYISTESKGEKSSSASSAASVTASPVDAVPLASISQRDVDTGMALFTGRQPLANGGPACISCHELQSAPFPGGGNLAPDLTGVFNRLGKQKGLTSWLNSPPPNSGMAKLFKNTPLKSEEIFSLVAVFEEVTKREGVERKATLELIFSGLGVGLSVLFCFGIYWRNRLAAAGGPGFRRGR